MVPDRMSWEVLARFAGYWLIQVKSLEEASEWAKRSPFSPNGPDQETEIEVREFIEFE
jgi:hypothetical protein